LRLYLIATAFVARAEARRVLADGNVDTAWSSVTGRVFTLLEAPFGSGHCGSVGVFPDGGALLIEKSADGAPARAWRVGLDGMRSHVATLPGPIADVGVDGPASFVTVAAFTRRIDRVDVTSGTIVPMLDLASRPGEAFDGVIALADGSVVVTDGFGAWRVRDGQMRVVVPARRDIHWISSLAPLESGAFAFDDLAHDRVVRVEQDGSRRVLASLAFDDALNASLAARGDDLVVVHGDAEGSRSRHVLSYFKGTSLVGSVRAGREARVYGDGDGFGAAGLVGSWAERAWLGGDGALLLLAGCSLRALVPGGSPRARTRCAHRRGARSPTG
jgi:hypothetical protein